MRACPFRPVAHWYDSGNRPGGTPDSTQEAIGLLPRVKFGSDDADFASFIVHLPELTP